MKVILQNYNFCFNVYFFQISADFKLYFGKSEENFSQRWSVVTEKIITKAKVIKNVAKNIAIKELLTNSNIQDKGINK